MARQLMVRADIMNESEIENLDNPRGVDDQI